MRAMVSSIFFIACAPIGGAQLRGDVGFLAGASLDRQTRSRRLAISWTVRSMSCESWTFSRLQNLSEVLALPGVMTLAFFRQVRREGFVKQPPRSHLRIPKEAM